MRINGLLLAVACVAVSTASHAQDHLYGLTQSGGFYNKGVPYQISVHGRGFLSYTDLDGNNGEKPGDGAGFTQLIPNKLVGKIFVALTELGDRGLGLGNRIQIAPGTGGLTPPFRFQFTDLTGINPAGRFLTAFDGTLYGLTSSHGEYGGGALFSTPAIFGNGPTTHVSFDGPQKGRSPKGSLIQAPNGQLYGMTEFGGANDMGVIFTFHRYGSVPFKKLVDLDGVNTGSHPTGNLLLASDGKLYGLTRTGGNYGDGAIFSIALDGTGFTKLLDFNDALTGANPRGALVEFTDGKLYGMTSSGGTHGHGTIFSISKDGTFTVILNFDGINGSAPRGDLLVSVDGAEMYGTTFAGGKADKGVLFKLDNDNVFTKLYEYEESTGSHPVGSLAMLRNATELTFAAIPEKNTLSEPFTPSVQSSAGLPIYFTSSDPSVAIVDGDKVRITGAGAATITAFQLGNHKYLPQSATQMIVVKKVPQTIDFPPLDPKTFGDPSLELKAVSSSGLPVTFSAFMNDVITLTGNIAYIKGGGTVSIRALQEGNNIYAPATVVERELLVNRADQTVQFTTESVRVCCSSFSLSASASSKLEVLFKTPQREKLDINGSRVEILELGRSEVIAYQPGNRNFNPAEARASIDVVKGSQSIYLNLYKTAFTFGEHPVNVSAASTSGLPVTYTSSPPGIAVIEGGLLHLIGVGTTTITATQSGNELFHSAQPVSVKVTVNPPLTASPDNHITWFFPRSKTMVDPPFNLTASSSSGLPVKYTSSNSSVAQIFGNLVTIKGTGTTTITASQAGYDTIPPAAPVEMVLNVTKGTHFINLPYLSSVTFGAQAFPLPLRTSAGLPIIYSSSNASVAYVENYFLHFKGNGVATLTASHPGNEKYLPAEAISREIRVYPAYQSITFNALPFKTYGDGPFDIVATASSGYPVTFSSSDPEIASIEGNTITIHRAGTVEIKATQSGYPGFSAAKASQELAINKATQKITFNELTDKRFSDLPFRISASTDSGLPVTFHSATPGVAKVSEKTVTLTGNGTAEIIASQPGNNNYLPAEAVSRKFFVEDAGNTYDLVGAVMSGGPNGSGGIYSMNSEGTSLRILKDFAVRTLARPQAGFIKGMDGRMYGNFLSGGVHNSGRIVKLEADGSGFAVLHDFSFQSGASPYGNLMQATNGDLYGVTRVGGAERSGVIFRIKPDGSNYTVLYSFSPSATGSNPLGGLIQASNGKIYGMTQHGGFFRVGTIYSLNDDGSDFQVILHFNNSHPLQSGVMPRGELVQGEDGFLYGTLAQGGAHGQGTLFKINPDGSGFSKLIDFNSTISGAGASPSSGLVIGRDGTLYGMTQAGGANNLGTIFSVTTDGNTYTRLLDFDGANTGSNPVGRLTEGTDGSLYGMSFSGGANSKGVIFKINKDGSGFHKMVDLDEKASSPVFGALAEASPGNFIGMTSQGGANNGGAIVGVSADGILNVLHDFPQSESGPRYLISDLTGTFYYGVTAYGGASNGGTIFRMDDTGTLYERLMEMPTGLTVTQIFYMSTGHLWCTGTENGINILFRMKADGSEYQRLIDFDDYKEKGSGASWLVEATDGNICGISARSAADGAMVFRMKNDGSGFAKVLTFPPGIEIISGGFIEASDGIFYGCSTYSTHLFRFDKAGNFSMFKYPEQGGNVPMKIIELNGGSLAVITRDDPGGIFTIEKDGKSFSKVYDGPHEEGGYPVGLLQTMDGWLYVAMQMGGMHDKGVIFKIRPDGSGYHKVREFTGDDGDSPTSLFFKRKLQTITFPAIPKKKTLDTPFVPDAFSSSGARVLLTSSNTGVAVIEQGKIKPVAEGTTIITAAAPANANFFQAQEARQQLTVARTAQTITFDDLPIIHIHAAPLELHAISSSGLPVTFTSSDANIVSIVDNKATIRSTGTVVITASQPGDGHYLPAEVVQQELVIVNGGPQSISFKNPGPKVLGEPAFELEASASSNLPVSFNTDTEKISITGSLVTILEAGSVSITASQEGNAYFEPASAQSVSFCINPPQPVITVSGEGSAFLLESSNKNGNQWYLNDIMLQGATDQTLFVSKAGMYAVVTTVDGCSSELSLPHDLIVTGVRDDPGVSFHIYPNPLTSGSLNVEISGHLTTAVKLEIVDALGRSISRRDVTEPGTTSFEWRTSGPGVYLMLITIEGRSVVRKIIKQ